MKTTTGCYIILRPDSNTNHSNKYRIVWSTEWTAYVNGARSSVVISAECDTYTEAVTKRDELNNMVIDWER